MAGWKGRRQHRDVTGDDLFRRAQASLLQPFFSGLRAIGPWFAGAVVIAAGLYFGMPMLSDPSSSFAALSAVKTMALGMA